MSTRETDRPKITQPPKKVAEADTSRAFVGSVGNRSSIAGARFAPIVQQAWPRGANVRVHGVINVIKDGRLRNLDCSIGHGHRQTAQSNKEAVQ